jgi:hypothetical protein
LLALVILASFIASMAYPYTPFYRVIFIHMCELHGCPPLYPAGSCTGASLLLSLPFVFVAAFRWLLHMEARCGIRLSSLTVRPAQMVYVRRAGVTREAAAAALARFVPRNGAPQARVIAVFVFTMAPLALFGSVGMFLSSWLQLQWIPG